MGLQRRVTNRVFLLGLDDLYRAAMKRHESTELLQCARAVASSLNVEAADVPIEGYYTESVELTEYFRIIRSLQAEPDERRGDVEGSSEFSRIFEVTSSPIFGVPAQSDSLLPAGVDPLTTALRRVPDWTIEIGLAALTKDPLLLTALRESVVLYAELILAGAAPSEPEYVWEVDEVIETRAGKFVETFNQLFSESLPLPLPENASRFAYASDKSEVLGRCVRIGIDPETSPARHYHWAIDFSKSYELEVVDFWDTQLWTTEAYRETKMKR